jgi:RND family efflux transporter MFP subunit
VLTVQVKRADDMPAAKFAGVVRSQFEVRLAFRSAGQIIGRDVELGSKVERNAILMRLDPSDVTLSGNAASAQNQAAKTQALTQRQELDRAQKLLDKGFISQAEFDRQLSATVGAEAQSKSAGAQESTIRNQIGYQNLLAPRAGVIGNINAESGDVVAAGQVVAVLVDPKKCEIQISVPENQIAQVRTAKEIEVRILAEPAITFAGHLRTLSEVADATTRTFDARIAFDAASTSAKIGQTAEVSIKYQHRPEVVRIPLTALDERGGSPRVWITNRNSASVAPRAVTIAGGEKTDVLISSGIAPGEEIVATGVQNLHDDQKISFQQNIIDPVK